MVTRFLAAPAKVNLSLRVFNRRGDGMHNVASLMAPIDLCDLVRVRRSEGRSECLCAGVEGENLALRAADALGVTVSVGITKRIPIGAGLGGGSSDAAAVLRALGARHRLDVAARLGADVPFFLLRGPAWATGTGAELVPAVDLPPFALVLAWPVSARLSTPDMYRALGRRAGNDSRPLPPAIASDFGRLVSEVSNDFISLATDRVPEIESILRALDGAGAAVASISGKGPAVFGLFPTLTAARAACTAVRAKLPNSIKVVTVRGVSRLTGSPASSI